MKLVYLLSVFIYSACVMAMPKKVSLTPLSSEEDFGTVREGNSQTPASFYLIDDLPKPRHNAVRGLKIYELPYTSTYLKRLVEKKTLDSIGGGHLI